MDKLFRDKVTGDLLDAGALQIRLPEIGAPHCLEPQELAERGFDTIEVIDPPALVENQIYGKPELMQAGDRLTLVTPVHDRQPVAPDPYIEVLGQIAALEAQQTHRRLREATLTEDGRQWLADLDTQIAALRAQLTS